MFKLIFFSFPTYTLQEKATSILDSLKMLIFVSTHSLTKQSLYPLLHMRTPG